MKTEQMSAWAIPGLKRTAIRDFDNKSFVKVTLDRALKYLEITPEQLRSPSRKRELVLARHQLMYFFWCSRRFSLKTIGKMFGRDHTSVIHAREAMMNLIYTDPEFSERYAQLSAALKQ